MAKPTFITSPANPLLKDVRRALARGSLTSDGLLVAETFHLLEEALRSDLDVPLVIAAVGVRSAVEGHVRGLRGVRVAVVSDASFHELSATETAQGVIALVRPPEWKLENVFAGVPLVVALDGVQDPGNAGAIVRAAEAFGASGVLFLKGSVSPCNAKTVRASAGSLFRLPFVSGLDADLAKAAFRQRRLRLYATVPRDGLPVPQADLRAPAALVIGSEGHGVSEAFREDAQPLSIPTRGVESLNAALAAAVVLYEAARQRTKS
ncbi:MAG TPA: RNA methyltransferase [Bryobacterales bacterium]|nr:RNA methyltransferase [Bryobacterales bacterium]